MSSGLPFHFHPFVPDGVLLAPCRDHPSDLFGRAPPGQVPPLHYDARHLLRRRHNWCPKREFPHASNTQSELGHNILLPSNMFQPFDKISSDGPLGPQDLHRRPSQVLVHPAPSAG